MAFIEVAKTHEVAPGSTKAVDVEGTKVLLINVQGTFYAIGRTCTHLHGDLGKGTLDGKELRCPRHGARFDVTTGVVVAGPKIGPFQMGTKDQVIYAVKVEGDSITVDVS